MRPAELGPNDKPYSVRPARLDYASNKIGFK